MPEKSIREFIEEDEGSGIHFVLKVRPVEPNVIYVNEQKNIELKGVPTKAIEYPKDSNGNVQPVPDSVRQFIRGFELDSDSLIDYSISTKLEGRGRLVHPSLYELTFDEYKNRVRGLIPEETRLEIERLERESNEVKMEMEERGEGPLEILGALLKGGYSSRHRDLYSNTPPIALGHQFLDVFIGNYSTDEETSLGLRPVLESEAGGRKDYEVFYVVNDKMVKADRVQPGGHFYFPIYRFPFPLEYVGSVGLYLPQEDLRGTFRVVDMEIHALQWFALGGMSSR